MGTSRLMSTQSTYEGPWQKWLNWSTRRQIDLYQASVANITNFLIVRWARVEYSTLNTYHLTRFAFHPTVDGHKVGWLPFV